MGFLSDLTGGLLGKSTFDAITGRGAEKAAEQAAQAQEQAAQAGIAEQRRQFDITTGALTEAEKENRRRLTLGGIAQRRAIDPFRQAGLGALEQQQALLGSGSPEQQQAAQAQLTESEGQKFVRERAERSLVRNAAALGGLGCMRGNTRIYTEHGLMRICDVTKSTRVLSWNEKDQKFQLSASGGSFPKGRANLYRVTTKQGGFVASGHHRLLSSDHTYLPVEDLNQGDEVSCSPNLARIFEGSALKELLSSDLHCNQKDANYLENCADKARQYGRQLLTEAETYQFYPPSQDDAQELNRNSYYYASFGAGDLMGQKLKHTHQDISSDLTCMMDYSYPSLVREGVLANQKLALFFERILHYLQESLQSLSKLIRRCKDRLLDTVFHSFFSYKKPYVSNIITDSLTESATIINITKLKSQEPYFDLQVANTNNYVCENGFIHHNSGNVRSALVEQGAGFAAQLEGTQFDRLANLAGRGQEAAGQFGQSAFNQQQLIGAGAINTAARQGQFGQTQAANIGNLLQTGGQARASGILGAQQGRQQGVGNLLQAGSFLFSDKRLKTNIKKTGGFNGYNWYSWTWNAIANSMGLFGDDTGVIANEVQSKSPHLVKEQNGFLTVNYAGL